ncbi:unnamed protein product [Prunus armeniaca]
MSNFFLHPPSTWSMLISKLNCPKAGQTEKGKRKEPKAEGMEKGKENKPQVEQADKGNEKVEQVHEPFGSIAYVSARSIPRGLMID